MEFTKDEFFIIENALISRKVMLDHVLNGSTFPVSINKLYNEEIKSITSLVSRFMDEYSKLMKSV